MFPIVLPLPRTSASLGAGVGCFLAHAGSASIASGLRVGAFPSKVTVPATVDAARATPGQTATASSPAATHNVFDVLRILVSFINGPPASVAGHIRPCARDHIGQSAEE